MAEEFVPQGFDAAEDEQRRKQANQAPDQTVYNPGGTPSVVEGATAIPDVVYQGNPEVAPQLTPPEFVASPAIDSPQTFPAGLGAALSVAGTLPLEQLPVFDEPVLDSQALLFSDPFIAPSTTSPGVDPLPEAEPEPNPEPIPEPVLNSAVIELSDPVVDEGGSATITATVSNAPDGTPLVITLDNGAVITIGVGDTSGSVTFPVQGDDPYVDGESFGVAISGTSGGNYEALDTSDVSTVSVKDTIDPTVVELGDLNEMEGTSGWTLNATIQNPPTDAPLVIYLSNSVLGSNFASLTFDVGQVNATSTLFDLSVYQHGPQGSLTDSELDFTVSMSLASGGQEFEFLDLSDSGVVVAQDDAPSINEGDVIEAERLEVDESDLTSNATIDLSDNFDAGVSYDYGADGPAGSGSLVSEYTLNITSAGADSGLNDVLSGEDVLLRINGDGDVEGYTSGSGDVVFRVSVNGSGIVELDQLRAVEHPDPSNSDESVTLSHAELVSVTREDTITDGDGDQATHAMTLNLGTALSFRDDAPSIDSRALVSGERLMVDESDLAFNATADLSDNFDLVFNYDYGADGPALNGSLSSLYVLSVSVDGADSGLNDVLSGEDVLLRINGDGDVEGYTSGSRDVVFRVSVDGSGIVELDQLRAVEHDDPNDPNDSVTLISADLIRLTRTDTISDRDGDLAKSFATLNLGRSLLFRDDAPRIQLSDLHAAENLVVDESTLDVNATIDLSDNFDAAFSYDYGEDGEAAIDALVSVYSLSVLADGVESGLVDVATGERVLLRLALNGEVEGYASGTGDIVFRVIVDEKGMVVLDQIRAVEHPDALDPDDPVSLSSSDLVQLTRSDTITDGDGDQATQSQTLNLGRALLFHDDAPSFIGGEVVSAQTLVVDETSLSTNASIDLAADFDSGFGYEFGADGPSLQGSIVSAYSLHVLTAGVDSGLDDVLTGEDVFLRVNSDGDVEGYTSMTGNVVFLLTVNGSGTVELNQLRAVVHDDPHDPDDSVTLRASDLIRVTRTDTITDADGDQVSQSASLLLGQSLIFHDDAPMIAPSPTAPFQSDVVSFAAGSGAYEDLDLIVWSSGADGLDQITSGYVTGLGAQWTASPVVVSSDGNLEFSLSYQGQEVAEYSLNPNEGGNDSVQLRSPEGVTFPYEVDASLAEPGKPEYQMIELPQAGISVFVTATPDEYANGNPGGAPNASNQGWGVDNQNIDPSESLLFEFYALTDQNLDGVDDRLDDLIDNDANNDPDRVGVNGFSFELPKATGGGAIFDPLVTLEYVGANGPVEVEYSLVESLPSGLAGVPEGAVVTVSEDGIEVTAENGSVIATIAHDLPQGFVYDGIESIRVTNDAPDGGGDFANFNVNAPTLYEESVVVPDIATDFSLVIVDGDGDTASVDMSLLIQGQQLHFAVDFALVPPVVIDLDRDGQISYVNAEAEASPYDLTGAVFAAWVAGNDGVLVYDYNADGLVTEAREVALTMWGDDASVYTDLQALSAYFDTNDDGVFDSSDAAWGSFGVWQDANMDGIQQQGEFASLDYWEISSIALSYDADSQAYEAVDGLVEVSGQFSVEYEDGTLGLGEDVAFVATLDGDQDESLESSDSQSSMLEDVDPIGGLVSTYLETMQSSGDLDGDGNVSVAELAYGLDEAVTSFLEMNSLSADEYESIQQEVFNQLAHQLTDLDPDNPVEIALDEVGDADAASVLAALDDNFDNLLQLQAEDLDDVGAESIMGV